MVLMRKTSERGQVDLTDLGSHDAESLASAAMAFIDRKDRMLEGERRLMLASTLASLAVYKELQTLNARMSPTTSPTSA